MRRYAGIVLMALCPLAAAAQQDASKDVKPWGSQDFTFHRVGVPPAGAKLKIVQIDPNATPYHLTPATPDGVYLKYNKADDPNRPAIGSTDWFWSGVSPALTASNPMRLDQAVGQLSAAKASVAPSKDSVADLVRRYGDVAARQTKGTIVSPALVLAVMSVESGGDGKALSPAGAQGLMQLMPDTARRFGVEDPTDPDQSVAGGVAYLNFLLRAFGEDPILALAGYNAGEGAVAQNNGVPPYAETRAYVPKVLGAWTVARLFCKIPPDAVTDPCDFVEPPPAKGTAVAAAPSPAPAKPSGAAVPASAAKAVAPKGLIKGVVLNSGVGASGGVLVPKSARKDSGSDG